jgi:hypothetical protein
MPKVLGREFEFFLQPSLLAKQPEKSSQKAGNIDWGKENELAEKSSQELATLEWRVQKNV